MAAPVGQEKQDRDDNLYAAYLGAYAKARSGGEVEMAGGSYDLAARVAVAIGANEGAGGAPVSSRALLLRTIDRALWVSGEESGR